MVEAVMVRCGSVRSGEAGRGVAGSWSGLVRRGEAGHV